MVKLGQIVTDGKVTGKVRTILRGQKGQEAVIVLDDGTARVFPVEKLECC